MDVDSVIILEIRNLMLTQKISLNNGSAGCASDIVTKLKELYPGKPTDGTENFIAYTVPGKDRMKLKTGRFLVRKLNIQELGISDKQISEIADRINKILFPNLDVRLCKGKEITENYHNEIGGHSCMTGSDSVCVGLYEINPDRFQQLIMRKDKNSARAIVHWLDNGRYFMDRVYSDNETLRDDMRKYAIKKGWGYRLCDKPGFYDVENIDAENIIISGLLYEDGRIPYMDTLIKYLVKDERLVIFHPAVAQAYDGYLQNTDGNLEDRYTCESCGDVINEDEIFYLWDCYYCEDCFNERGFCCSHCGELGWIEDGIEIQDSGETVCQYCADRCYGVCKDCGEYFGKLEQGDYCSNCIDNHTFCIECGEESDDLDQGGMCQDCAERMEEAETEDTETMILPFTD
jgi:hypothetical protein